MKTLKVKRDDGGDGRAARGHLRHLHRGERRKRCVRRLPPPRKFVDAERDGDERHDAERSVERELTARALMGAAAGLMSADPDGRRAQQFVGARGRRACAGRGVQRPAVPPRAVAARHGRGVERRVGRNRMVEARAHVQTPLDALEAREHLLGRLHPRLAVFRQRLAHEVLQRLRRFGEVSRERRRLLVEDGDDGVARRLTTEGDAPRQHLVEHDAERPDVCARVHLAARRLLGRHVADGAHHRAGVGDAARLKFRGMCKSVGLRPGAWTLRGRQ